MKTQTCKDCKTKVSKLLHYCPHCGRDFVDNIPGLGWVDGFPPASEIIKNRHNPKPLTGNLQPHENKIYLEKRI